MTQELDNARKLWRELIDAADTIEAVLAQFDDVNVKRIVNPHFAGVYAAALAASLEIDDEIGELRDKYTLVELGAQPGDVDASCQVCVGQGCQSCGFTGRDDTHDDDCDCLDCKTSPCCGAKLLVSDVHGDAVCGTCYGDVSTA